jgi:hypothetical protein
MPLSWPITPIERKLWDKGWAKGRLGFWYRPFPRHMEGGMDWSIAAREIGCTDAEILQDLEFRKTHTM